eukprot:g48120.t1
MKSALDEIYAATKTLETKFPEALFIGAGDFNQANLKQVMPKYHQHISCPTRGLKILDDCYTTKGAYHYNVLQAEVPTCIKKTTIIPLRPLQLDRQLSDPQIAIGENRKKRGEHTPIYINGPEVERVKSIKFLGATITDNLSRISKANATVKRAQQRLRNSGMSIRPLTNVYRCIIKSI